MWEAIEIGASGLAVGARNLALPNVVMMGVGFLLLYLGIKRGFEPLLLVPIGFGAFLVNLPLSGLMEEGGMFRILFNTGIANELFPLLIFVGIGAMTDFGPLLENPKILLLGAAGQFGIFLTLALSLVFGFSKLEAAAIGIIGACDGPTAIYVTSKYAPHLLAAVSVAAYSYMSLVPIIQPPIIRLLTTKKEKVINMGAVRPTVSKRTKLLFPVIVTLIGGLIAPRGIPLIGMICLGNFMKESGVVSRLTKASENEIANMVTLFLGLTIGATMQGQTFLRVQTLIIFESHDRSGRHIRVSHVGQGGPGSRATIQPAELPPHARHGGEHRGADRFGDGGCGYALHHRGHGCYLRRGVSPASWCDLHFTTPI
jgi:oxaloacetate decarboxylase beta subunit